MLSQVTIQVPANDGKTRHVWFLFQTDHSDLFDFNEALAADGTIFGERIDTEPAGPGKRREVRRADYILGRDAVVTVSLPQDEFLPARQAAE